MTSKPDIDVLENRIRELERDAARHKRASDINRTLFRISNAVNTTRDRNELFGTFHHLKENGCPPSVEIQVVTKAGNILFGGLYDRKRPLQAKRQSG